MESSSDNISKGSFLSPTTTSWTNQLTTEPARTFVYTKHKFTRFLIPMIKTPLPINHRQSLAFENNTTRQLCFDFVFNHFLLVIDPDDLRLIIDNIWTHEFIELLITFIRMHQEVYISYYLLFTFGNCVSSPNQQQAQRFLANARLVTLLKEILMGEFPLNVPNVILQQANYTPKALVLWIITNIFQSYDRADLTSTKRHSVAISKRTSQGKEISPSSIFGTLQFIKMYLSFMKGEVTHPDNPNRLKLLSFRCLCAIFAESTTNPMIASDDPVEYVQCYQEFLSLILQKVSAAASTGTDTAMTTPTASSSYDCIDALLSEYDAGLERKVVAGFYPDAFDRALTCQYLLTNPVLQGILVEGGVIDLLLRSLTMVYKENKYTTLLLWQRAIAAIYYLTKTKQYHDKLCHHAMVTELVGLATGRVYEKQRNPLLINMPILPLQVRKTASRVVMSLGIKWEIQRVLWIAVSKPQEHSCVISKLPVELIRSIMMWIVLLGGLHDDSTGSFIYELESPHLKEGN